MKKKSVVSIFVLTIVVGFLVEVFAPELQQLGLSERLVDVLSGGITVGGLVFLAVNWSKSE